MDINESAHLCHCDVGVRHCDALRTAIPNSKCIATVVLALASGGDPAGQAHSNKQRVVGRRLGHAVALQVGNDRHAGDMKPKRGDSLGDLAIDLRTPVP